MGLLAAPGYRMGRCLHTTPAHYVRAWAPLTPVWYTTNDPFDTRLQLAEPMVYPLFIRTMYFDYNFPDWTYLQFCSVGTHPSTSVLIQIQRLLTAARHTQSRITSVRKPHMLISELEFENLDILISECTVRCFILVIRIIAWEQRLKYLNYELDI